MKTAIITGANRGIGLETALAFGRAGWKVFATVRNPKTATALQSKIKEESLPVIILAMDVNSDESVDTWQIRHPVGPDALPFLGWRASMTDEQWIDWNSTNDEDYYNAVERDFGMNLRQVKLNKK